MLIDININIMDNDGIMVHHFEKRFSDEDNASLNNSHIGESFEHFLSEYMSISGIMVRDKLISDSIASKEHTPFPASDEVIPSGRGTLHNLKSSEITYQISIGHKNVYVGRIPLALKSSSEHMDNIVEEGEHKNQTSSSLNQELEAFDHMISYTMSNAIAKYEANLYPTLCEEADELQPTDISASLV